MSYHRLRTGTFAQVVLVAHGTAFAWNRQIIFCTLVTPDQGELVSVAALPSPEFPEKRRASFLRTAPGANWEPRVHPDRARRLNRENCQDAKQPWLHDMLFSCSAPVPSRPLPAWVPKFLSTWQGCRRKLLLSCTTLMELCSGADVG